MESERIKSISLSTHLSLSIMLSFTEEIFENHEKGCDNLSYFVIESPKVL